jgi:hypothetical protein
MRLGMKAGREIVEVHYRRYLQAGKKDKGKIPDEVSGTTGLNRDHLAQVLSNYRKKRAGEGRTGHKKREPGKRDGRPPRYQNKGFAALLISIREDHGRPCSKLSASLMGHYRLSYRVERAWLWYQRRTESLAGKSQRGTDRPGCLLLHGRP